MAEHDDDPAPELLTARATGLHEELVAWLRKRHPGAPAIVVITALTYEIGRLVGQLTADMNELDTRSMVNGVRDRMLEHVNAWRRGLRH